MSAPKPVVLCILDGWGIAAPGPANAPFMARTPNFDAIIGKGPSAQLVTHGPDVGLPEGQMGNSEVGHMNIGAGRIVLMDLGRIDQAIASGSFFENAALADFIDRLRVSGGRAHLLGLMSDGGVHGHMGHMIAAAQAMERAGLPTIVHAVTDGRDVAPKSALAYLDRLQQGLPQGARIGTVLGRYYAMDRDRRWERVMRAFDAITRAIGPCAPNARAAIEAAYERGETDEFIAPTVIKGYDGLAAGEGLFCLNFRADRARQMLAALGQPRFDAFETGERPRLAALMGMMDYSEDHMRYMTSVFRKAEVPNTLGAWVASHGLRQFRLAETEKYPHVTFFLNCGREEPAAGEDRCMPHSSKVATYDLKPDMASAEVTEHLVAAINDGYDLIVTNYANPDMVGHSGRTEAAIAACEAVDRCLGKVLAALEKAGGAMIVTADHGNCEMMVDPVTGGPHTAHTLNPVPVVLVGGPPGARLRNGRLADLAPTLLHLMGLPKPAEMTGQSLIECD
ncbi:2,3-bisphosphoglycerate-independent phosphoglycerate mutase [Pontibaca methylaminivorans]|uniref:2,3-bisphosphoglycerate-independent phosphoglycerate mutase n=1 Tax=Pontibaca methylaminivorans TaxID=515897 RepID=A0A1R3WQF9_9RHOB|nr:2,3-bisphosphoglycerate-independent phosphoglycerate mutase [Pontibaca methylaminivorans]SIT80485.1 phosphoglycerate mutase [Pontibaca methylaminivorans]